MCGDSNPQRAVEILGRYFNPSRSEVLEERRGKSVDALPKTLYSEWGQNFEQGQILVEAATDHQQLVIFENQDSAVS